MSTTGDSIRQRLRPHDVRLDDDAVNVFVVRAAAADSARALGVLLVDALAITVSPAVFGPIVAQLGGSFHPMPGGTVLPLVATVVLGIGAAGGYARRRGARLRPRRAAAAGVLAAAAGAAWLPLAGVEAHTGWVVAIAAAMLAVLAGRFALLRMLGAARRIGRPRVRAVLIGPLDRTTESLARFAERGEPVEVVARLSSAAAVDTGADGSVAALDEMLRDRRVDRVILTDRLPASELDAVLTSCFRRGTRVERMTQAVPGSAYPLDHRVRRDGESIEIRPLAPGVPQLALKRALDLAAATTMVVLLSPMFFLIALAIRLDSSGPIFFGQRRVGVGGRTFTMWKFRTMVDGADRMKAELLDENETDDPRLFKISSDPRVTRVGHWLRSTSLDELPQLFNVVRGEMSLVGPRPFFPEDLEHYEPHHVERLTVLPGMTGLWQVSGRSDIRDFDAVAELDREYIRRWSVGLDLRILLRTIPAVFNRDGAY